MPYAETRPTLKRRQSPLRDMTVSTSAKIASFQSQTDLSMDLIRLLLADDHPDVLSQLAKKFRREPGILLVGEAENSAQAIALTLAEKPDVVLIDPMMRDRLGLNAVKQIMHHSPGTELVVLTAVVDTALQIELRKLGVHRVLIKGLETSELLQTIQTLKRHK